MNWIVDWNIFRNTRLDEFQPKEKDFSKIRNIVLAIAILLEFFRSGLINGLERHWDHGYSNSYAIFEFETLKGLIDAILIVFFYLLLRMGIRFSLQDKDLNKIYSRVLSIKLLQLFIWKDLIAILYFAIRYPEINSKEGIYVIYAVEGMHIWLMVMLFILSYVYLMPVMRKRLENQRLDQNRLVITSLALSIFIFSVIYVINYTVIRILLEVPFT